MEKIYLTARYKVKPDSDLELFKEIIQDCIHTVARHCPNTLEYYWYYDQPDREFVLRAKFEDSQALDHQLGYQRKNIVKMRLHAPMDIEIYGNIDELTLHQFSLLNAKAFSFYEGISKDNRTIGRRSVG